MVFNKLVNSTHTTSRCSYGARAFCLLVVSIFLCKVPAVGATSTGRDYFPDVTLQNQDGETLHFYDDVIQGKVVTINFMFTSCGDTCPLETAKLREVQDLMGDHVGKDVYMFSISVDPERDTPEALKAYMERFKVGPGWQFLTGKQEDIDQIRKKLGMYAEDEDELSDHNINFVVGNEATGQWMKRTPFDVPQSLVSVLLGRLQKTSLIAPGRQHDYHLASSKPNGRDGEEIFRSRCSTCHTIGGGDKLGPDLLNVSDNRDRLWLMRWLKEPDVMLQEKDPLAMTLYNNYGQIPMPNLQLTDAAVLLVIEFMQGESRRVNALRLGLNLPDNQNKAREQPASTVPAEAAEQQEAAL